jgi:hypothetical protein
VAGTHRHAVGRATAVDFFSPFPFRLLTCLIARSDIFVNNHRRLTFQLLFSQRQPSLSRPLFRRPPSGSRFPIDADPSVLVVKCAVADQGHAEKEQEEDQEQ